MTNLMCLIMSKLSADCCISQRTCNLIQYTSYRIVHPLTGNMHELGLDRRENG